MYNELFTMHGTLMLLLFATPLFIGFTNVIMPLQIGAPDAAFPRMNLLSYYFFLFGGLILVTSFLTPGGAAAFGWHGYSPLTSSVYSPGIGGELWVMGLVLSGLGTILGGVNFVTTIFCLRAPGMTMFRMPIFTWNALLTSMLALLAFPTLAAALLVLELDWRLGAHVFDASTGGPILWQNLFWFFGHPEVYILALPFFGIATEILPEFSRKPLFGYKGLIAATIAITGLSMTVWAHHMFTTGAVLLPFFSLMSFFIAIPTGVKFFNWAGTMWKGQLTFEPPMLFTVGFLLQRVQDGPVRREGQRRGPVGVRQLAGVGHLVPAAAAQLLPDPAHPVRAPRLRPALPPRHIGRSLPVTHPDAGSSRRAGPRPARTVAADQ